MVIGVPREIKAQENRIAMTPFGAENLTSRGHEVLVQVDGGLGCGFDNEDYRNAGAVLIKSAEEIFERSELIDRLTYDV